MYDLEISTRDGRAKPRQSIGSRCHAFAHRSQITGAGRNLLFETLSQYALEKRFGEGWRQFGTGMAVAAPATIETDGHGCAARPRRVAVDQGCEFVVGQPDLRHALFSRGSGIMFTCNSDFLFKIGHSNDKKRFYCR